MDMPKYTMEHCIEIETTCSVKEVYDLWENLENVPRWIPLVKEVKILPGSEQLSRWRFGLGEPLIAEWTSQITERIPMQLIVWQSVSGLQNYGSAQFFPADDGSRLRLKLAFNLPGGIIDLLQNY